MTKLGPFSRGYGEWEAFLLKSYTPTPELELWDTAREHDVILHPHSNTI